MKRGDQIISNSQTRVKESFETVKTKMPTLKSETSEERTWTMEKTEDKAMTMKLSGTLTTEDDAWKATTVESEDADMTKILHSMTKRRKIRKESYIPERIL